MNDQKVFKTKDLVSATYIACNGIKFAGGYEQESMSWVFSDPDRCSELDLKLRNGESNVEVTKYESTRRTLLGMVPSKR